MPEGHVTAILSGNDAWNMQGNMPVALTRPYLDGVPFGDLRQLELVLTPHGFLKAALAASSATAISLPIVGPSDFGPLAEWKKGDDRLLHHAREVQSQRDDQ